MYVGYLILYCKLLGAPVCRNNGVGVKNVSLSIDSTYMLVHVCLFVLRRPSQPNGVMSNQFT